MMNGWVYDRGQPYDGRFRRALLRMTERGRQEFLRRNPQIVAAVPEFRRTNGMDNLTLDTVNTITHEIQQMNYNERMHAFRTSPVLAHHFPHLDPRNFMGPARGPVLPLDRRLLVLYLLRLRPEDRESFFHRSPWLRHQFPEFQPPEGWPPRLFMPARFEEMGSTALIEGPPERLEDFPIQDPFYDPEPYNYVESRMRERSPSPPRRRMSIGRSQSPLRLRLGPPPLRSPSPPRLLPSPPRRTPSPRIHGQTFRRSPPTWHDPELVDTTLRLGPPGTHYRSHQAHGADEYFDPERYRRGDHGHGYINGYPPAHIYHDFDSEGYRVPDEYHYVQPQNERPYMPVDPRGEVDYNRPPTRQYPARAGFDHVWDDNFTPAEHGFRAPP